MFHGVMRFYLQDQSEDNFATKCIRVSSTSTTKKVIETLLEKFRPDVSTEHHSYFMYEVCGSNGGFVKYFYFSDIKHIFYVLLILV